MVEDKDDTKTHTAGKNGQNLRVFLLLCDSDLFLNHDRVNSTTHMESNLFNSDVGDVLNQLGIRVLVM